MANHLQQQSRISGQHINSSAGSGPPPPPLAPQRARTVDVRIPAIEKYAYCLCLHVKPATIFIAIFKLVRSLLFASILLNNEISLSDHGDMGMLDEKHKSTVIAVNIFSRIIIASVAALAIYAVMYNRAALLMPLYAVLLVDFFFSLPVFYNRDLVDPQSLPASIEDAKNFREGHLPRYSFMFLSTISMLGRIYFLCVIWKCYRYLRLIELVAPIAREFHDVYPHITQNIQYPIVRVLGSTDSTDLGPSCGPGLGLAPPSYDSVASAVKPPNYEEAVKSDGNIYPITPSQLLQHQQQILSNLQQPTPQAPVSPIEQPPRQNHSIVELAPNPSLVDNHHQQEQQHQNFHHQRHQRYPSNQIVPTSDNEQINLPTPHQQQQQQPK